jgi:hypothetical protein
MHGRLRFGEIWLERRVTSRAWIAMFPKCWVSNQLIKHKVSRTKSDRSSGDHNYLSSNWRIDPSQSIWPHIGASGTRVARERRRTKFIAWRVWDQERLVICGGRGHQCAVLVVVFAHVL